MPKRHQLSSKFPESKTRHLNMLPSLGMAPCLFFRLIQRNSQIQLVRNPHKKPHLPWFGPRVFPCHPRNSCLNNWGQLGICLRWLGILGGIQMFMAKQLGKDCQTSWIHLHRVSYKQHVGTPGRSIWWGWLEIAEGCVAHRYLHHFDQQQKVES